MVRRSLQTACSGQSARGCEKETSMILGTPRRWWFAAAVPLLLGFVLLATGDGTMLRTAVAILLLIVAMVLFGIAPMRYGQRARTPPPSASDTLQTTLSTPLPPPRSRAPIEGWDPSEV